VVVQNYILYTISYRVHIYILDVTVYGPFIQCTSILWMDSSY